MEESYGKKKIHVAVTIIFTSVLSIFALTGGHTQRGEMRQIEDSMRNLRRTDNMWLSYSYTISDKTETITTRTDVWADQLTSSWVAEYYATDIDGTILYLKRYCDGTDIYTYESWSGEWLKQAAGKELVPPYFNDVTTLEYGSEDITDVETVNEDEMLKISYTLTPEYLASLDEENFKALEKYYKNYNVENIYRETKDNMQLIVEQHKKMRPEDVWIAYRIDGNGVLHNLIYSYNVVRPELITEENGDEKLGEDEKIRNLITFEIKKYNEDSILEKIEQYASEII